MRDWAEIKLCQHRRLMHWVQITLCQYRQEEGTGQKSLCEHHRRHSRRGITKNVHSLCISLDCRRQDQSTFRLHQHWPRHLKDAYQGCIVKLESRPARSHSQQSRHPWRTVHWNSGLFSHRCLPNVFALAPISLTMNSADLLCHSGHRSRRHVPPVVICSTMAPNAGS